MAEDEDIIKIEEDFLDKAKDELKRVDHLIFVTLKYTRTVDVLRSVIQRIISCFDYILDGILTELKEQKKIDNLPQAPGLKCNIIKKELDDETIIKMIGFYQLLRKLMRAKYDKEQEFRRHVTMTSHLDDGDVKVDIDISQEYYNATKKYVEYIANVKEDD